MQYENWKGIIFSFQFFLFYNYLWHDFCKLIKEKHKVLNMSTTKKIDPYLQQKVMSASPAQLVSYIYDIGISACINNDKIKLNKVLSHLKETLDYSPNTREVSNTFLSVYDHISFLVRNNRFDEAKNNFLQIKTVWKEANQLH